MPDQPTQNPPPTPDADDGWHTPGEADEADLWHSPDAESTEPVATPPAVGSAFEGWYVPPEVVLPAPDDDLDVALHDSGWYVPEGATAGTLLAGVDDTIPPPPEPEPAADEPAADEADVASALPEPEPAPDDEEATRIAPEAALQERLREETGALDEAAEPEEAIGPGAVEDAASIAAQMAAQLEAAAQEAEADLAGEAVADDFFPTTAEEDTAAEADEATAMMDDAAAIAAQMAARYTGEAEPLAATEAVPGGEAVPEEATSPLAALVNKFDNVEEQVQRLRSLHARGEISREDLRAELRKLMLLDEQGAWWMVGLDSDVWYRFENGDWVQDERPRLSAPGADDYIPGAGMLVDDSEPVVSLRRDRITLDEDNMPVVHRAPRVDPDATLVGESAVAFDRLPSAQDTLPAQGQFDPGLTQPATAASAAGIESAMPRSPLQPDYDQSYAAPDESDLYRQARAAEAQRSRGLFTRLVVFAIFAVLGLALLSIVLVIVIYSAKVNQFNERIESLADLAGQFETTRIYDGNGELLTTINDPTGGTRISIPLADISPWVIHAAVSVENERFYEDPGWDAIAILRAALQNLQSGEIITGASTITQQLARLLVLDPERRTEITYDRKLDEVIIAGEIGRRYSKNEILEIYLNEVYFGNLAYGIEAAAQTYFGIPASEVNMVQAAFLVGLIQSPATYDPVTNREIAFARMEDVMRLMREAGCIQFQHAPYVTQGAFCVSEADFNTDQFFIQRAEVLVAEYSPPATLIRYPHFVQFVAQQLEEQYGFADIYRTGFNVYTTIQPRIQDAAQTAVVQQIAALSAQGIGGNNGSVVVMDPRTGAIWAMVGSADFGDETIDGQVNVAMTPQQPGSAIKPIVYTAALQGNPQGAYWTPGTVIWDTQTCWGTYCPPNYDGEFHGPQSMRSALANSYNIPAVKALEFVTPDRFAQTAQAMGLTFPGTTPQQAGLPGALGGFDVRLFDMVVAFGTLANNGQRAEPYAIVRITDNEGNPVPLPDRPTPQQVIQPEHAYLITSILSDDEARATEFGRGSVLTIPGYNVAAKTGTTNDNRDNWTLGYAPNVVVGVWHGNTDNTPMRGTSGFRGAAPIWNVVMRAVLEGTNPEVFTAPPGVVTRQICADSGTLPSQYCVSQRNELFAQAQPPPGPEQDIYRAAQIDTLNGLLANEFCDDFVEQRLFFAINDQTAFPWLNNTAAGQRWVTSRGFELPAQPLPTQACTANTPSPIIGIDIPQPSTQVQGLVEVRGRVFVFDFARYQLEYGVGEAATNFQLVDGPYPIQHQNSELLGSWDVSGLPNGPYTLRLHVETNSGGYANLDQVVFVNNPAITDTPVPTMTWTPSPTLTQPPVIFTLTPTATPTVELFTPPPVITNTPTSTLPPTVTPGPVQTALPPHDLNVYIPVVYGAQASDVISDAQVGVYYGFEGAAGDSIQIAVENTAGDLDPLVYLLDAAGNQLAMDDDGGSGTNSLLQYTLPGTGRYLIVVTRFNVSAGVTSGEFRMTLTKN